MAAGKLRLPFSLIKSHIPPTTGIRDEQLIANSGGGAATGTGFRSCDYWRLAGFIPDAKPVSHFLFMISSPPIGPFYDPEVLSWAKRGFRDSYQG